MFKFKRIARVGRTMIITLSLFVGSVCTLGNSHGVYADSPDCVYGECSLQHRHTDACGTRYSGGRAQNCQYYDGELLYTSVIHSLEEKWYRDEVRLVESMTYCNPNYDFSKVKITFGSGATVTENGDYQVTLQDKSGNVGMSTIKVRNLDKEAPVIKSANFDTTAWTSGSVTLTVNAEDRHAGIAGYALGSGSYSAGNVFVFTQNGDYMLHISDNVGNVTDYPIKISNIDQTAPVISEVVLSPKDWTSKAVTVTVKASDSQSGLASKPYSFDGGNYTESNSITVTANRNVSISVKDAVGNVTSKTISVTNIDTTNPVVGAMTPNTTAWTNKDVKVTVSASDGQSGLDGKPYSYDGGANFVGSNEYVMTDNGTLKVIVRDKVGNSASQSIKVTNIDKGAPSFTSLSRSTTSWTNKDVTINVSGLDSLSGLAKDAYSFNGGNSYQSSNSFVVGSNQKLVVAIRDVAGNVTTKEVVVDNIDKDNPNISSFAADNTAWTNKNVTVRVNASDATSGLNNLPYSFDGGATYQDSPAFVVGENATYSVIVRDKAGNTSGKSVTVGNIDRVNPVIAGVDCGDGKWSNKDVTINISASDALSGLNDTAYSFDGGLSYLASSSFNASQNGDYFLVVRDKAGNTAKKTVHISNIDKKQPNISRFSPDDTEWTNQNVVLKVRASDSESGLQVNAYSYDNKASYCDRNSLEVAKNGTYSVNVIDNAGNVASMNYEVKNIDKDPPIITSITKSCEDWTEDEVVVTINASDSASGLAANAYSFDGGKKYTKSNSCEISKNGTYPVWVRDVAGNIAKSEFSVANIGKDPAAAEQERLDALKKAEEQAQAEALAKQEAEAAAKKLEEEAKKAEDAKQEAKLKEQEAAELAKAEQEAADAAKEAEKALEQAQNADNGSKDSKSVEDAKKALEEANKKAEDAKKASEEAKKQAEDAKDAEKIAKETAENAKKELDQKNDEATAASKEAEALREEYSKADAKVDENKSLGEKIKDKISSLLGLDKAKPKSNDKDKSGGKSGGLDKSSSGDNDPNKQGIGTNSTTGSGNGSATGSGNGSTTGNSSTTGNGSTTGNSNGTSIGSGNGTTTGNVTTTGNGTSTGSSNGMTMGSGSGLAAGGSNGLVAVNGSDSINGNGGSLVTGTGSNGTLGNGTSSGTDHRQDNSDSLSQEGGMQFQGMIPVEYEDEDAYGYSDAIGDYDNVDAGEDIQDSDSLNEMGGIGVLPSNGKSGKISDWFKDSGNVAKAAATAGVLMLIGGVGMLASCSFVFFMENGKPHIISRIKTIVKKNRIVVTIPAGKLKPGQRYRIFHSVMNRKKTKGLPTYIQIEGDDNMYELNNDDTFAPMFS